MDPRATLLGQRDDMMMLLGELKSAAVQGAIDRRTMDKKIDDLGGSVLKLSGDVSTYVANDFNEHKALNVQIERIIVALGDETSGIVKRLSVLEEHRVRTLEERVDGFKNFVRGSIWAASVGFTVISAIMTAIGIWLGRR